MKMKRSAAIVCALTVASGGTALAANQGSQEDPLLTLSYLDKVLRPQLETEVDAAVERNKTELGNKLDQAVADGEKRVNAALSAAGVGAFQSKTLARGESFTPGAGRELLLTSGSATAVGTLTDTTAGKSVSAGANLELAHLYVTVDAAAGCKATSDAAVMSR